MADQNEFKDKQVENIELLKCENDPDELREQEEDCEKHLDKDLSLDSGEIITDNVTPRGLVGCLTNSLEKALEVSHKLKVLSSSTKGQEREADLVSLSSSVQDFAFHLLNPIKSKDDFAAFEEGVDVVVDKALSCHSKKFLSHPVILNLLMKEWKGLFYDLGWWSKLLLHILVVFDMLVYPLVFLGLYLWHFITKKCRTNQTNKKTLFEKYIFTPHLIFLRDTVSFLVLVILHFLVCIQPTVLQFSVLEWIIMVFFIGRIFNEIYQVTHEKDKSQYISNLWNLLDISTISIYVILFVLRVVTWGVGVSLNSRLIATGGYIYGINSMILTLRVCGQILEYNRSIGTIQIALFKIIGAIMVIAGQLSVALMAFSFAITKVYLAEMTYSSGKNSTLHGLCTTQDGLSCWWQHVDHLAWSLVGSGGPDVMKSSDDVSDFIAKFLYMLFLLNTVILVMNMLIAVINNTYQKVEDNAFLEWSYKKARTVRTYRQYHPVPVPFNIISLTCLFFKYCCCKKPPEEREGNELTENFLFLIRRLESIYFAEHGYSFPLTDGNKLDQVLRETEGNRHLSGHIAENVFKQDVKQHMDQYWKCSGIRVDGQQLLFCSSTYRPHQNSAQIRHGARHLCPLSTERPGFEVLIKDSGQKRYLAIGVVEINYSLNSFPGWRGNSIGFHVDDGKIFDISEEDGKRRGKETGHMAQRGDLIGCFIMYAKKTQDKLPVCFTLNGTSVGEGYLSPKSRNLYPFIGIGDPDINVIFRMPTVSNQATDQIQDLSDKISALTTNMSTLQRQVENLTSIIARRLEGGHFQPAIRTLTAKPLSITSPVFIEVAQEATANQAAALKRQLVKTEIMTVVEKSAQIKETILVTSHIINRKACWVAYRESQMIVPPMGINQEETMARNLSQLLRHEAALKQAKSPTDERFLLKGVDFKVMKVESFKPYGTNSMLKKKRIIDGLEQGIPITEEANERQNLTSHLVDDATGQLKNQTGDAFVFQVTNNNNEKDVFISVLLFQFDGSITILYPKNSCSKIIQSGCSVEDIQREFIPKGCLRIMAQPDLSRDEPNMGIDTLVLYASSKEVDLRPLTQSPMKTDPDLTEGVYNEGKAIGDFQEFVKILEQFSTTTTDDFQWMIEKKKLVVVKNPSEGSPLVIE